MIVDDTHLIYTGKWGIGGTSSEYRSTTHGTNEAGASASFTFIGTSVAVYGTIAANAKHAVSTYSVDGSHAVTFTAIPVKIVQYRQLFYQISHLPYGQHHLVITSIDDRAQFWLDFLEVDIAVDNTRSSAASSILIPSAQTVIESPSNVPITVSSTTSTLHSSSSKFISILPSSTRTLSAHFTAFVTTSPVSAPTLLPTSSSKPVNSGVIINVTYNLTSSLQMTSIVPYSSVVSFVLPSSSASFGNYAPPASTQATSTSSGNHAGAIAGGVIATFVCIALAVVAFLWVRRRRAMRAPSRQAPKTPDPNWFKGHSFQWPDDKGQVGQP